VSLEAAAVHEGVYHLANEPVDSLLIIDMVVLGTLFAFLAQDLIPHPHFACNPAFAFLFLSHYLRLDGSWSDGDLNPLSSKRRFGVPCKVSQLVLQN
jgi:hypothetical protein